MNELGIPDGDTIPWASLSWITPVTGTSIAGVLEAVPMKLFQEILAPVGRGVFKPGQLLQLPTAALVSLHLSRTFAKTVLLVSHGSYSILS